MALPTYLELVNDVLVLMREPEVESINENTLSSLVSKFINQGKRVVEDAWKWNALRQTIPIATQAADYVYYVTGSGARFKVDEVWNATQQMPMSFMPMKKIDSLITYSTPQYGPPTHYSFNGIDASTGDVQVYLYPVPDDVYTIPFHLYVPQEDLSDATDVLLVPKDPVVQWAYARSLVERGEDGGLETSEAYQIYKGVLADFIAIEMSRFPEEEVWGVN